MAISPAIPFTVPGPRPAPVLGPIGNFMQFGLDRINFMGRVFKQYGRLAALAEQDRQFEQGVGGVRGNVREMVALPNGKG